MASVTRRRARRIAKKLDQQRESAVRAHRPLLRQRGGWFGEPPFPDEPEGGAGVREPRRPLPTMPTQSMALDPPVLDQLDLSASAL
jgi:hypothetical protein